MLTFIFNVFSLLAVWWLTVRYLIVERRSVTAKIAMSLAAIGYSCWYYSILFGSISVGGLAIGSTDILRCGELAAVLTPMAFFAAVALPDEWWVGKRWIAPVLLSMALAAGNIADIATGSGYTGVFSIWSVGLTLWLPWPIYAVSIGLFLYAVLTCFAHSSAGYGDANVAMGMLLILYAGYNLQLTYQHLLVVLAFALLTGVARPIAQVGRGGSVHSGRCGRRSHRIFVAPPGCLWVTYLSPRADIKTEHTSVCSISPVTI